MSLSFVSAARVAFLKVMSTVLLMWITLVSAASAHETVPAIADMEQQDETLAFSVRLNVESLLSGIDLASITDTNDAPEAEDYDNSRAQTPADIEAEFIAFWPEMAEKINVTADGAALPLTFDSIFVPEVGNVEDVRTSELRFTAAVPADAQNVTVGWAPEFGTLVLRQMGVEGPYTGTLLAGDSSDPIALAGGNESGAFATFFEYIPVGFDHIVPKGLDHILFVLGLFFLSTRMGPLLWQVSAFTVAHTITLALAALGYVNLGGTLFGSVETIVVVEALIALSIVYVAIENLFTDGLSPWRPFIIFGFGLLHGLGFASVLAEFGLPDGTFIPALIGFNIGVEVGQLAVIAVAFICVMKAIENSKQGNKNVPLAIAYLVAMVAVFLVMIPLADSPILGDIMPLLAIVSILLGLSAASSVVARFDGYREIVAMPGSILIAVVAAYWCVERVFL